MTKKQVDFAPSLALETLDGGGTNFSWKMFDFLGEDTISDIKVGSRLIAYDLGDEKYVMFLS